MSGEPTTRRPWRSVLEAMATLSFIVVSATVVWAMLSDRLAAPAARKPVPAARRPEPPVPVEPVSLEGAAIRGNRIAKVAVIEHSDFQCPYCGRFAREILPELEKGYVATGKVLLAFRQFPLTIHAFAEKAAEAAECAGRQGRFWEMHDRLFVNQQQLDAASLQAHAKALQLGPKVFEACLAGEAADKVKQDTETGKALLVTGTPTFFIGTIQPDGRVKVVQRVSGALPLAQFEAALDRVIAGTK